MSRLEETLLDYNVEWIRLKIFHKQNIAVGCYLHKKGRATGKKQRVITVDAFISRVSPFGEEIADSLPATERKFRKTEKEIALWYFRELCHTFKNGIFEGKKDERKPFGKWD